MLDDRGVVQQCGFKALHRGGGVTGNPVELRKVMRDLLLVMRKKNRVDVGEVLVERGTTDSGGLRDERHRQGQRPQLACQTPGGLEDRLSNGFPMLLDGCAPHLRHRLTIRYVALVTLRIEGDTMSRKTRGHRTMKESDVSSDQAPEPAPSTGGAPGVPRWVFVTTVLVALVVLIAVLVMVLVGGDHGPGRHLG